jgi:hypothetical protein
VIDNGAAPVVSRPDIGPRRSPAITMIVRSNSVVRIKNNRIWKVNLHSIVVRRYLPSLKSLLIKFSLPRIEHGWPMDWHR